MSHASNEVVHERQSTVDQGQQAEIASDAWMNVIREQAIESGIAAVENARHKDRGNCCDELVMTNCFPSDCCNGPRPDRSDRLGEGIHRKDGLGDALGREDKDKLESSATMSNGDTFELNAHSPHGFKLTDKDGNPVRVVSELPATAMDLGRKYELSNGAIYTSRGAWSPIESLTYPNGDTVRFTNNGILEGGARSGKDK